MEEKCFLNGMSILFGRLASLLLSHVAIPIYFTLGIRLSKSLLEDDGFGKAMNQERASKMRTRVCEQLIDMSGF